MLNAEKRGRWLAWLGIEQAPLSHSEKWISALGAGISIALIYWLSAAILPQDAYFLVASMGASAVLLFAVPHGPLSQPWPLIVGHLSSAFIGVTCAYFVDDLLIAAALAVGFSVWAMTYLRAIHPPGGATALSQCLDG